MESMLLAKAEHKVAVDNCTFTLIKGDMQPGRSRAARDGMCAFNPPPLLLNLSLLSNVMLYFTAIRTFNYYFCFFINYIISPIFMLMQRLVVGFN